ncbi:hypothetical protein RKE25_13340 [Dyella sp. BiH032]|uniref:hypothetical protein n=1 Tax=Dyella sp. BiH032 TaxID=3075430 RepID=UPI00289313BA|nr:hypothetical protein [Dyella sp. BiH032]WNL44413.1 hypothetical protein RKE25_13340 [Dyella sp. BiH032]
MARAGAAFASVRVRMRTRELKAARADWASRRGAWVGAKVGFGVAAIGGGGILLGGVAQLLGDDRHGGGWIVLMAGGVLLALSLAFLWAIRRQAWRSEVDLALGSKLVVDGVVSRRGCHGRNGDSVYSIRVCVSPHERLGDFVVPKRVFENLSVGDVVRCAYLPTARILLSLSSAKVSYAIGKHG